MTPPATTLEAIIGELCSDTGLRFTTIGTGGNCTALAATTESGHEVLLTDRDGHAPTSTLDPVWIAAYTRDGSAVVFDQADTAEDCATLLMSVLQRIPRHDNHFDDCGTLYCDTCRGADRPFTAALGLIP